MTRDDLCWLAEEACANAWPSPRQVILGRWVAKLAGGPSRRINSLNPMRAAEFDPAPALADCAALYAAAGRPLIVRVPAIATGLASRLAALGGLEEGETCTLLSDLSGRADALDPNVALTSRPDAEWLDLRAELGGRDEGVGAIFAETLRGLVLPTAFAALRVDGQIGSMAFGVLDRRMLVIEAVATPSAWQGRGLARRTVSTLMAWARRQGATEACLQVVADNAPARALYAGLGYASELYRYHYARMPDVA